MDAERFQELYRAFFPKVYAYVAYRIGRTQDAEDVVSDVFTRVVQHIGEFRGQSESAFAAWIFRIARNAIADFFRRNGSVLEVWDELEEFHDDATPPEGLIVQSEDARLIRQLIGTLSPRRQQVILLKFFAGLRNREIAAVLDLDERSVASHLCRGLESLHQRYKAVETSDE